MARPASVAVCTVEMHASRTRAAGALIGDSCTLYDSRRIAMDKEAKLRKRFENSSETELEGISKLYGAGSVAGRVALNNV